MVRGSAHAHVAMSKLVLVILAEQQRFERSIPNPTKQHFSLVFAE
jgi:hypothetical protein